MNAHTSATGRNRPISFHREANLGPWREMFRGLIDAGVVRDQPVEQIIEVISDLLYGTMFTNYFASRKSNLASQCESIFKCLLPWDFDCTGRRAAWQVNGSGSARR